ncbi:1-deoxy-D-xylulose-5-phosphate reductoisomerase [Parasphingopyxis lamellibrachiae]|uniref:1-deoxy-D-xylulose 5-phosphate reductoisomerase n=1 Tax=Parasphingopyxis lamellibrachiae TaxID=680125 RepID=A0A3D9FDF7_9SPHN|nr:1-deoxy-D-xylulose-5-phosphate reductoisomerase [Parasphingopyxis lamellibrachiae]RED15597.1 1-deoxy-D-xylulose 5-phosphate reductoisomerase [Parasphingopyxis lamellibrachiae]
MAAAKRITILGATGSVGQSTLDLINRDRDDYEVIALTANEDVGGLARIARESGAKLAVIGNPSLASELAEALAGSGIETAAGADAICDAAAMDTDLVMAAIVGAAGIPSAMAAIEAGNTIGLANKESLVSAGSLMLEAARKRGVTILPVDSEHNAIFQCFDHDRPEGISSIILTASGGPFRQWSREEMRNVTPERAVQHPNWSMGAKISIDSATLMNKGLELIEARYLFDLPPDDCRIIVHPQSVIHSLVEYRDGSVLAQLGAPDMRVPIAHVLAWPQRMDTPCERLDLAQVARLDFEEPDTERFPALKLARSAMEAGGARPAILNAANEEAVAAFLGGRIGFLDIAAIVADVLGSYAPDAPICLDDVFAIDKAARIKAQEQMDSYAA